MKMRIQAEGSREGRAQVPSGEGLILSEGVDRAARQIDLSESSSECIVSVPFARGGFEIMDVCGVIALSDIEVDAIPCAESVD